MFPARESGTRDPRGPTPCRRWHSRRGREAGKDKKIKKCTNNLGRRPPPFLDSLLSFRPRVFRLATRVCAYIFVHISQRDKEPLEDFSPHSARLPSSHLPCLISLFSPLGFSRYCYTHHDDFPFISGRSRARVLVYFCLPAVRKSSRSSLRAFGYILCDFVTLRFASVVTVT